MAGAGNEQRSGRTPRCIPCLAEYNEPDEDAGCCERLKYAFMCPPHGKVAMWISKIVAAAAIWGTFWAILGDEALPGGNFFSILVLIYACVIAAAIVELTPFPPLLGMLLVGFCLRNVPKIDVGRDIDKSWASTLRTIALVVILIRAGSGLDPNALKKVKWMALRLAFFPCVVEAAVDAVIAHFLLDFPWMWAFVMGFVFSAVSPAVVVPSMIGVQEKGLGVDEGIPTLLIAACSVNDVIAISGFGIVLGMSFSNANLIYNIFHGPLELVIGVAFGVFAGLLFWFIPNKNSKNLLMYRFIMVTAFGLLATFGFRVGGFPGAGALGTLIMAFVAGIGWRRRGWTSTDYPIKAVLAKCWKVFQPLLFGLIGNAVSIENLQSGDIGIGVGMLFIGLAARLAVTFLSSFGMDFNLKEKLFITISWLPKATVQAAIGPVALDTARQENASEDVIAIATSILTFAVLSILITAPLGAAGIGLTAPILLKKSTRVDVDDDIEALESKESKKDDHQLNGVNNPAFQNSQSDVSVSEVITTKF
ncbi:sodium/hydrogen exchanger 9B2 [Patella vulgata]|uniref:sodium/hydrogen exchanger 9B2 n=1 Tax=Patella vulgata TaxID=6465 RepID=UPI00217F3EBB|nr:sodium/hydrogen exchanger 9B2 [Patella vulgata]XP_050417683.1 sodium/hydrogen exchanger 9B2 [Patella vulgata]